MLRSLATSKPTVNDEDLVQLQKFTEDFGQEGWWIMRLSVRYCSPSFFFLNSHKWCTCYLFWTVCGIRLLSKFPISAFIFFWDCFIAFTPTAVNNIKFFSCLTVYYTIHSMNKSKLHLAFDGNLININLYCHSPPPHYNKSNHFNGLLRKMELFPTQDIYSWVAVYIVMLFVLGPCGPY